MQTDRELLELAAKAAGYTIHENGRDVNGLPWYWCDELGDVFDPLHDDGAALRLAAKLRIDIEWDEQPGGRTVEAYQRAGESYFCATEAEADYRRAIVRAAAGIAQAKEGASNAS